MPYTYESEEWEKAYQEMVEERLARSSILYVMGSPEWMATFEKLIQQDEHYKEVARTWEGTVVIHILAKPSAGLSKDLYLFMDLWHGDYRSARLVPKEAGENTDFILTGDLER
ncbi:MAG: hypothetical protein SVV67_06835 [Bacillota bacterium]|nr:hypothetical protein [Bacillota bacterium]